MKRPLVIVALLYVAGVSLGEFLPAPLAFLFPAALVVLVLALLRRQMRPWLLSLTLVLTGYANMAWRTAVVSPFDLRTLVGEAPAIVTVRGTLAETPTLRVFVHDEQESWRTLAPLDVTSCLRQGTNWEPACGRVLALTPGIVPANCFAGTEVEVTGVLSPPPRAVAEGLFDYRAYLRRQGIYYQLKNDSTNDWRRLAGAETPPWSDRFLAWAQATMARGLPCEDDSLHLLWYMTLGWRTALTNEIYEPFMKTGTMHIFAISGLHIALIAGVLVSLLRLLRVPRAGCGVVVVPLIWFYTAASGWQPSALRSTLMMSVIIGGWALARPGNLINSLAAAAFIVLLWDPQQLFGASFQLSFLVVLSIGLFVPPLERARDQWLRGDPLLPADLAPRWQRWGRPVLRFLTTSLATSLAAWLGSLPLTAWYFHLFGPVTLLANLIIVPLSSLALACNMGSLICAPWLPFASELFNHSAWWWMHCMVVLSDWFTQLPKAYFYVRAPGWVDFVLFYGLLVGTLSGWLWAAKRRLILAGGVAFWALFHLWQWQAERRVAALTILPLSGGMSISSHAPRDGPDLLADTGPTNAVEFVLKPFLRAQGMNVLPHLVLTHGDLHHVGGAGQVSELFRARQVSASPVRMRSRAYRDLLADLERTPGRLARISRGQTIAGWQVLHPAADDRFARADDNSLVLYQELNGARVLLLSDLGRSGQEALLSRYPALRADIVVTGLPSNGEPVCDALLDLLQPRLLIVADSEYPSAERASAKTRERLAQRKELAVVYTRLAGTATIRARAGEWEMHTAGGTNLNSSRLPPLAVGSAPPSSPGAAN
jgi:ComEC/Rec2-related protein